MKEFIVKLSKELFKLKLEIEKELLEGNKTDEELYSLILKIENFLKAGRGGNPVSKKLPIYKYFENKYGVANLFLVKLTREARAFYIKVFGGEFKILQIVLEIHKTHTPRGHKNLQAGKEYEKKGGYN